jgi:predicted transcriptional regulator
MTQSQINTILLQGEGVDMEYAGKTIMIIQVPASSLIHDHAGRIYIRKFECDIDITGNQHKIRELYLKKGSIYTENQIYPGLSMSDLDESLFDKARNLIRGYRSDHPWLTVSNEQMLRDAILFRQDFGQTTEGVVVTKNPNNPYFHGVMNPYNFNPHPKNPNIRKFFTALGWADEIGSGIRNTLKYLPFYVGKVTPIFIDEHPLKTVIPLVSYSMSAFAKEWCNWLDLEDKWFSKLSGSLEQIPVDATLVNRNWKQKLLTLLPNWNEAGTKLPELDWPKKSTNAVVEIKKSPSPSEKVTKSLNFNTSDNQQDTKFEIKKAPSSSEKVTKSLAKKVRYIIVILSMLGNPASIEELMEIFDFQDKTYFRKNYIKALETVGFITRISPDKPTASNQKYYITEKGKLFLTGQQNF